MVIQVKKAVEASNICAMPTSKYAKANKRITIRQENKIEALIGATTLIFATFLHKIAHGNPSKAGSTRRNLATK